MLYCLKLVVIVLITLPAATATILTGLLEPYGRYAYHIGRFWAWLILKVAGVSLNVDGSARLDPSRPYVFMVNHQSNIDIPVLMRSLPGFQLRWIAKKELLRIPLFGWALWAGKHLIVDRGDRSSALATFKRARQHMQAGVSIVIFPEGTRSTDGRLLPFKHGGFLLAAKTGAAIVPVTINGSRAIVSKGDWRLRSGAVEVSVGEPLTAEDSAAALPSRALSEQVRALIAKNLRPMDDATDDPRHQSLAAAGHSGEGTQVRS